MQGTLGKTTVDVAMASPAVEVHAPVAGPTTFAIAPEPPRAIPVTFAGDASTAAMLGHLGKTTVDVAMASPAVEVHAPVAGHTTIAIAPEPPGAIPVTFAGDARTAAMPAALAATAADPTTTICLAVAPATQIVH